MATKRLLRSLIVALEVIMLSAGVAHAHGGMAGPDELGPPVGISVAIGLACYYLITLWPARTRENSRDSATKAARRPAR